MIGLLFSRPAAIALGLLAVVAVWAGTYVYGFHRGQQAVYAKLQADHIAVLKDGVKIDKRVLEADDDELCAMLGTCSAPVECVPNTNGH